jgi:TonB family protein
MSARFVPLALVLACRPDAPPSTAPTPTAIAKRDATPPPIAAGRGVLVRAGATVWLDAAGTRPLVLPDELPRHGVAMRVIADHGALLEVEVDTTAPCRSFILDHFALRLFVARDGLRDATATAFEHTFADGKRVAVEAGAAVDGVPGKHTIAVHASSTIANLPVADTNVARDFVAGGTHGCIEVLANGEAMEVPFEPKWTALLEVAPASSVSAVRQGVNAYWNDGAPAGKVAQDHEFVAPATPAGTRLCFALPLAQDNATTLCLDGKDVRSGTAGTIGLSNTGVIGIGKAIPQVRQAKAEVHGKLDKDIVRRIVRAHINEIRHCYNKALVDDPAEKGRVVVRFTIDATGHVTAADPIESSVKNAELPTCMATAIKRWKFPKPEDGGSVGVTYPFLLDPG